MIHDLECPYCEAGLEINHDDGFGYDQNVNHEMECSECVKTFVFQTEVSFNYTPKKADCLNGEEHNYEITKTFPKCFSQMRCTHCYKERDLTESEMKEYGIESVGEYLDSLKRK